MIAKVGFVIGDVFFAGGVHFVWRGSEGIGRIHIWEVKKSSTQVLEGSTARR